MKIFSITSNSHYSLFSFNFIFLLFFMILIFSVMILCLQQMLKRKAQLVNNKSQLVRLAGEWLENGAVDSDVVFLRIN